MGLHFRATRQGEIDDYKFESMLEWYIKSNSEDNVESLIDKCALCKTLNGQSIRDR